MANFGGTITAGIQDISALLPLLGTEQCERHVASALVDGYLYVAVTPLSIFGSLGIFKAGFVALISSLHCRSVSGAQKLADAGFKTDDDSPLSMITVADGRYVAETRLLSMLRDQHIDNVENLTLESGLDSQSWNWRMFCWSLTTPIVSLFPYVYFILRDRNDHTIFATCAFPVARAFGSLLVALMVQFVIQYRVLSIMKKRLIFMAVEEVVERSEWSQEKRLSDKWSQSLPSEKCLRNLERYLQKLGWWERLGARVKSLARSSKKPVDLEAADSSPPAGTRTNLMDLQRKLDEEMEKHFSQSERRLRRWALPTCQFLLFVGLGLSVVGYVGCFSIVQGSQNTAGPLLWLGLESALSFIRMLVWGWNPGFDDDTHLRFKLELVAHKPEFTQEEPFGDIMIDDVIPLDREQDFLQEITSCIGPLPRFDNSNVSLYYTYGSGKDNDRVLYITVFDYKERDSVTLVRTFDSDQCAFFISSLIVDSTDGTLTAKVTAEVHPENNHITADKGFMKALREHWGNVVKMLKTDAAGTEVSILATWTLKGNPRLTGRRNIDNSEYLEQRKLERRKGDFTQEAGKWISNHIEEVKKECLDGTRYREFFLTEWEEMEKMLLVESTATEEQLRDNLFEVVGRDGREGDRYNQELAKSIRKRLAKESLRCQSRCVQVRSVPGLGTEGLKRSRQIQRSSFSEFSKAMKELSGDALPMDLKQRWSSRRTKLETLSRDLDESIGQGNRNLGNNPDDLIRWEQMEDKLREEKDALVIRILLKELIPPEESTWDFRKSRDKSIANLNKLGSKYFSVFSDADLALLVVAAEGLLSQKVDITAVHFRDAIVGPKQPTMLVRTKEVAEKMKSVMSIRNFPHIDAAIEVLRENKTLMSANASSESPSQLLEVTRCLERNRKAWESRAMAGVSDFESIVFYEKPYIDRRCCVGFFSNIASGTTECTIYIYTRIPRAVGLRITYSCVQETKLSIQFGETKEEFMLKEYDGFRARDIFLSDPFPVGFHVLRLRPAEAPYECWLSNLEVVLRPEEDENP